jgi:hypothetical protein
MAINVTTVFSNAFHSILSNQDLFSITIDLMDSFLETHFDEINLIPEGSDSLLTMK